MPTSADRAWMMAPEGAVVHVATRTAVVADLHLGYEWARARGGDVVPAHSLAETLARLATLFDRAAIGRLVIAGDLVESRLPCPRTHRDVNAICAWLDERRIELVLVRGNHDSSLYGSQIDQIIVGDWTIRHGHEPTGLERTIVGHHHPSIGIGGLIAPCFLVSERSMVLPAFTPNAAGIDLCATGLPAALRGHRFRCIATSGEALFDFGPLETLCVRAAPTRRG